MSEIKRITVTLEGGLLFINPWPTEPGEYALVPLVEGEMNRVWRMVGESQDGEVARFDLRAPKDERKGERRRAWPYHTSDLDRRASPHRLKTYRDRRVEDRGREARGS